MISVYEGPLCCNTGVCGADPNQALVAFTADVNWVARQGGDIRRANLAQDPAAFADSEIARAYLQTVGADGLPLVVVDGVTAVTARYPTRAELARFAGLDASADTAPCCQGTAQESDDPQCCTVKAPCCRRPAPVGATPGERA